MEVGQAGWAGQAVRLMRLDEQGRPVLWAMVSLDDDGRTLRCEPAELLMEWEREGVVGRAATGLLFPRDGRRFLDELPFVFKSPYCFAEPVPRDDGPGDPYPR